MYNLVDLILIKNPEYKRDDIETILSQATHIIHENLQEGKGVQWVGLGTFTWKKKAPTKKKAAEWKEYPYLAEGEKARFVPEDDQIKMNGEVTRMKRELPVEVQHAVEQFEE